MATKSETLSNGQDPEDKRIVAPISQVVARKVLDGKIAVFIDAISHPFSAKHLDEEPLAQFDTTERGILFGGEINQHLRFSLPKKELQAIIREKVIEPFGFKTFKLDCVDEGIIRYSSHSEKMKGLVLAKWTYDKSGTYTGSKFCLEDHRKASLPILKRITSIFRK
jgi:hypothetical protein